MAPRRKRKKAEEIDPDTGEVASPSVVPAEETDTSATDALIEKIKSIADENMMFSVKAPCTTSVKRQDGTWRTDTINPEHELLFSGARQGARGKILFVFRPVELTHQAVEWNEEKVFDALGESFEEMIVKGLGLDGADDDDEEFGV